MAKPRIFISSTYYDLRHVRASLETFVQSLGYEPVLSEKGDIAYTPDLPLDESCYREAAGSDVLVLIIGGRYGAEKSESRTAPSHDFQDRYDSITKSEYKSALENNVPVYICIDSQVYAEYQTFLRNRNTQGIVYAHVDSINIFLLMEEILMQRRNNAFTTFSRYSDIEDWLRDQWAGVFRDLLKRMTQSQQLSSLSSQVKEMSEINQTLRTYLETLMESVSPSETKNVILSETNRLRSVKIESELENNDYVIYISHGGSKNLVIDSLKNALDFDDFVNRLNLGEGGFAATKARSLRSNQEAQNDLNHCREILGLPPFDFGDKSPKARRRQRSRSPAAEPHEA